MPRNETTLPKYREATRHLKQLLDDEIRTGTYAHLCRPNKRGGSDAQLDGWKARPTILARPPGLPQSGNRNLQIGSLEVMVVLIAPLFDETNSLSGFDYEQSAEQRPRYVIGTALAKQVEAASFSFHHIFRAQLFELREPLQRANYAGFVRQYAGLVNRAMSEFKKELRHWYVVDS